MLGIGAGRAACGGAGHIQADDILRPRLARAQHVQADVTDDRGQPATEVLDPVGVGAAKLSRSQASRTVLSASLAEPSIR